MMDIIGRIPVLYLIKNNFAYFTTQKLENQRGDNWDVVISNDKIEKNTKIGEPYTPRKKDKQHWEIIKVAWKGDDFETLEQHYMSWACFSPYSVLDINCGYKQSNKVWLKTNENKFDKYSELGESIITIKAGISINDFIKLIEKGHGTCYYELLG